MTRSAEDLQLFQECFNANHSPRTPALLNWQYVEPPPQKLFAQFAVAQSAASLAAIYAVFPAWMKVGDRTVLGTQSLDTLTHADFRGRGLFTKLAGGLYERLETAGASLVYGFPNKNSAHGFFKRLGWQPLGPLPFLIRPLRTGYVLRKLRVPDGVARFMDFPIATPRPRPLARGQALRTPEAIDEAFTELWTSFAAGIGVSVERSAAYLKWRLRRPRESYQIVAFYEDDRPLGWVVFGTRSADGIVVGKLMDLVYDLARPEVGAILVGEALRRLGGAGAGAVWAWSLEHSPNYGALRSAGFIPLARRFHPIELHFGALAFEDRVAKIAYDRKNWYISFFDSDTE